MPQKKQTKKPAKKQKSKKPILKNQPKILLVGCGKMGEAMLKGWRNKGVLEKNILVIEPNALSISHKNVYINLNKVPKSFSPDVVVFAIKPNLMAAELNQYSKFTCLFISIAAGKKISFIENCIGRDKAVARVMPNLAALVNLGYSAISMNTKAAKYGSLIKLLFGTIEIDGKEIQSHTIIDENLMDAYTAIMGSGPAYVFLLMEILTQIAVNKGFNEDQAKEMIKILFYGNSKLALTSSRTPSELREDVTSKGGTTEAALKVLMGENGLKDLMEKALKAAEGRAKQL